MNIDIEEGNWVPVSSFYQFFTYIFTTITFLFCSTFSRTSLSLSVVYKCIIERESKPFQSCCSQLFRTRREKWCSLILFVTSSCWTGWDTFLWNPFSALTIDLDMFFSYYSYSKDQISRFLWPSYNGKTSTPLLTKGICWEVNLQDAKVSFE